VFLKDRAFKSKLPPIYVEHGSEMGLQEEWECYPDDSPLLEIRFHRGAPKALSRGWGHQGRITGKKYHLVEIINLPKSYFSKENFLLILYCN
jgi:hypothetical protein